MPMISYRLLPVLLLLPFCGFIQDEWQRFSPDKKFSIEFPGEPMLKPEPTGVKNPLEGKTWLLKLEDQMYGIQYFDIPKDVPSSRKDVQDMLFSKVREGILQSDGAKVNMKSEKPVTVEKMPAREYEMVLVRERDNVTASLRGQIVIARDRVYVVSAMGVGDGLDSSSAARFFKSFKILKQ